jgi:peptidoglycan/xylan/chitin deacetylase (PgdA/CDA1 family)
MTAGGTGPEQTGPEQAGPEQNGPTPDGRASEPAGRTGQGRGTLVVGVLVVLALFAVAGGFLLPIGSHTGDATVGAPTGPAAVPQAPGAPRPLVVSLTFDDGLAGQMQYLQTLRAHDLAGTFYVNTGDIGQPNYMTRADLTQIAAAGNEIGGHSVSHPNLVGDAPDETARQICDDRATLTSWGFDPVSFAYPFGVTSPPVEEAVRDCGYTSGRLDHGLGTVSAACPACVGSESVPAVDPFAVRTTPDIVDTTTLADLEGFVTSAQSSGGGWVPYIFHHESCASCGNLSTSPALLDQFAAWLADQQRAGTLVVRTVGQTVGRPGGPVHTAPAATTTSMPDGDLSQASTSVPDCWEASGYGTNTAAFAWTPPRDGAPASETVTVSSYTDGDAVMLPRLDLGQCTPTTSPGVTTHLAAQYRSTVPTQFTVYRRTGTGSWEYWTASPLVGPSPDWRPIVWDTPPAPPDTTGVAAGLSIGAVGTLQSLGYVEASVPPPPLIPSGLRGVLEVGAIAAAALGLLGALAGLAHHYLRRRRRRSGPGHWGGVSDVPGPRPPGDGAPGAAERSASERSEHEGVTR